MGMRTVVVFNNDRHSDWSKDPNLGRKISEDMNLTPRGERLGSPLARVGGQVVECEHTSYDHLIAMRYTGACELKDHPEAEKLLQRAAESMGFRLVRKPVKKAKKVEVSPSLKHTYEAPRGDGGCTACGHGLLHEYHERSEDLRALLNGDT